jgi:hypothetical protein
MTASYVDLRKYYFLDEEILDENFPVFPKNGLVKSVCCTVAQDAANAIRNGIQRKYGN